MPEVSRTLLTTGRRRGLRGERRSHSALAGISCLLPFTLGEAGGLRPETSAKNRISATVETITVLFLDVVPGRLCLLDVGLIDMRDFVSSRSRRGRWRRRSRRRGCGLLASTSGNDERREHNDGAHEVDPCSSVGLEPMMAVRQHWLNRKSSLSAQAGSSRPFVSTTTQRAVSAVMSGMAPSQKRVCMITLLEPPAAAEMEPTTKGPTAAMTRPKL